MPSAPAAPRANTAEPSIGRLAAGLRHARSWRSPPPRRRSCATIPWRSSPARSSPCSGCCCSARSWPGCAGSRAGNLRYLDFLAAGILAQSVLFVAIFYGISAIWERDLGVLHRYLVSPAPRSALVLGKAALGQRARPVRRR